MKTRFLFSIILFLFSCNAYDIDLGSYEGEWSLPLVHGSMDAVTLVQNAANDAEVRIESNGLITLIYKGEELVKTKKDIFTPIPIGLPIPMLDTITSVSLPSINNIVVKKAILTNGHYSFSYNHSRMEDIKLSLWVPEMQKNNVLLSHDLNVPYKGGTVTNGSSEKFSMNDIVLTPINNKITLRYVGINTAQNRFKLTNLFFLIDQLDFKFIQGIIGQNINDLKKDSIELDLYSGATNTQGLLVEDPKMILTVENSFGFPSAALIREFVFQTPTGLLQFKSKLFDDGLIFNYPTLSQAGSTRTTTYLFDKTNSNIVDVVNAQASRVIYDIDALSNPKNVQDSTYFVLEDSKIKVNSIIEIPLQLKMKDYFAEKTYAITTEKLKDLTSGKLLIETTNTIPLSGQSQFYFLKENNEIIDSVFSTRQSIIKLPTITNNGTVTNAVKELLTIPVPENKINTWSSAKKVKISTWFNSPASGFVTVTNKHKLEVRMAFVGQLKL